MASRSSARHGFAVFSLAAVVAALAVCAQTATAAPFRAFSDSSPWNTPAAQKGGIAPNNPYASQFTSYDSTLSISGIPPNVDYAKPTFFAGPGDPEAPITITNPSWAPSGDLQWDGRPVPVPAGTAPAPGADGHLTIVSADRRTAWEFWGCTSASAAGIVTQVVAQWDLTGPGYSTRGHNNSARGSGTPLISTTLRADEALGGINHAIGLTVPHSSADYVRPVAAKSDGEMGSNAVRYGTLFVLRANYRVPARAGVGVRNLIRALKVYGAYVVDQGASMELDADSSHADQWTQAGLAEEEPSPHRDRLAPGQRGLGTGCAGADMQQAHGLQAGDAEGGLAVDPQGGARQAQGPDRIDRQQPRQSRAGAGQAQPALAHGAPHADQARQLRDQGPHARTASRQCASACEGPWPWLLPAARAPPSPLARKQLLRAGPLTGTRPAPSLNGIMRARCRRGAIA